MMDNRGALTLDFTFALVLVVGLSGLLLALSLTLVMVEVSQYVAFASSRVYFGGHVDEASQAERAEAKFNNLMDKPVIKALLQTQWFKLTKENQHDFRSQYPDEIDRSTFVGVRLKFTAEMLDFKIPFFGSTAEEEGGFKANLTSFLGREPTFEECRGFTSERYKALLRSPSANYQAVKSKDGYFVQTDNGC